MTLTSRRSRLARLAFFIVPLAGGLVAARAQPLEADLSALRLEDYVVSATRTPQEPASVASSVTMLPLAELAATQITDLRTALSAAETGLIGRYLALAGRPRAVLEGVEKLAYEAGIEFDVQLQPWVRRLKALDAAGAPEAALTLAPGFARPFGYYDGLVFEVTSAALGDGRAVAAGGRYDGLPARLGGPDGGGAVGCMVRPARAWNGAGR